MIRMKALKIETLVLCVHYSKTCVYFSDLTSSVYSEILFTFILARNMKPKICTLRTVENTNDAAQPAHPSSLIIVPVCIDFLWIR